MSSSLMPGTAFCMIEVFCAPNVWQGLHASPLLKEMGVWPVAPLSSILFCALHFVLHVCVSMHTDDG